jgi:hypothetical protein
LVPGSISTTRRSGTKLRCVKASVTSRTTKRSKQWTISGSFNGNKYAKYANDDSHGHGDYKKGINHGSPPTLVKFFTNVIQADIINVSPLGLIATPITFDGTTSRVNVNVRTTKADRDLRPEILPVTGYNVIDVQHVLDVVPFVRLEVLRLAFLVPTVKLIRVTVLQPVGDFFRDASASALQFLVN